MSTSKKPSELSDNQLKKLIASAKAGLEGDDSPALQKQLRVLLKEKRKRKAALLEAEAEAPLTEESNSDEPTASFSATSITEEDLDLSTPIEDSANPAEQNVPLVEQEAEPSSESTLPQEPEENVSISTASASSDHDEEENQSQEDAQPPSLEPNSSSEDSVDEVHLNVPSHEQSPQSPDPINDSPLDSAPPLVEDREQDPRYLNVTFHHDGMPVLQPVPLGTKSDRALEKFRLATKRREFNLHEDWFFRLDCPDDERLQGRFLIPAKAEKHGLADSGAYDGASIPCPWLISFLTMGAMRPLGILLMPSIVHDFLFSHGVLLKEVGEGQYEKVEISRPEADTLFYHMIRDLNDLESVAWVAYYAVRFGYNWVPYGGRLKGNMPIKISLMGLAAFSLSAIFLFVCWAWITIPLFLGHLFTQGLHLLFRGVGALVKSDRAKAEKTEEPTDTSENQD